MISGVFALYIIESETINASETFYFTSLILTRILTHLKILVVGNAGWLHRSSTRSRDLLADLSLGFHVSVNDLIDNPLEPIIDQFYTFRGLSAWHSSFEKGQKVGIAVYCWVRSRGRDTTWHNRRSERASETWWWAIKRSNHVMAFLELCKLSRCALCLDLHQQLLAAVEQHSDSASAIAALGSNR